MTPAELAATLDRFLRTDTFPVGVATVTDPGDLPPKTKLPARDLHGKIAVCQAVGMARKYGWTVATGRDDVSCPIAKAVFGFEEPLDYYTEGTLAAGMYAQCMEAGKRMEDALDRFAPGEVSHLVFGPLAKLTWEPETVVVYGNSAQVLRLVQASLWKEGGAFPAQVAGRADCSEIVIRGRRSGRPELILPCTGDRVFAMTGDHEMAFTFPFVLADEIVAGLENTHRAGVRYPVPQYLRFEAEFPPTYQELERRWREGERREARSTIDP